MSFRRGRIKIKFSLKHVKGVVERSCKEGAYRRLKGREHIAIFIRHVPLEAGTKLRIGYNTYKIEKSSYLVFIDLLHQGNFAHPVLYELHRIEDGSVRTIEEEWPIADPELERTLIPFILPGKEDK